MIGREPIVNSHNLGYLKEYKGNAEFLSFKELNNLCTIEGKFTYAAPLGDTADLVLMVTEANEV